MFVLPAVLLHVTVERVACKNHPEISVFIHTLWSASTWFNISNVSAASTEILLIDRLIAKPKRDIACENSIYSFQCAMFNAVCMAMHQWSGANWRITNWYVSFGGSICFGQLSVNWMNKLFDMHRIQFESQSISIIQVRRMWFGLIYNMQLCATFANRIVDNVSH